MKKIYILDAFHEAGIALAKAHAEVVCWPDPAIADWPEHADGVMVRMRPITAEEIERAKHVQVICKQGVGTDTIDLQAAKQHGIAVSRTPGVNSAAVAELAFALSLSVTRRVSRFDRLLRAGVPIVRPEHLGIEMQGKSVGIIGMGNIGSIVAKKWRGAFDAHIWAYDPYVPSDRWADLPHTRVQHLHDMLPHVDLLTLHLPLTDESRHMIGEAELALMKPDAVLTNVSRGGIVDEVALAAALQRGHLFGAGLDVFEVEPPPPDHPLLAFDNLIATPHAAGGTHDTQPRYEYRHPWQVGDLVIWDNRLGAAPSQCRLRPRGVPLPLAHHAARLAFAGLWRQHLNERAGPSLGWRALRAQTLAHAMACTQIVITIRANAHRI